MSARGQCYPTDSSDSTPYRMGSQQPAHTLDRDGSPARVVSAAGLDDVAEGLQRTLARIDS
jgi:hypothetical protein